MDTGLVHIYSGDGKGKTTAAIGLSIRCCGSGGKVLLFQFLKNNKSSERNILKDLNGVTLLDGLDMVKFSSAMSEDEKKSAGDFYRQKLEQIIDEVQGGDYQMLVLDETITAANKGFIDEGRLLGFLKNKPSNLEVVMTGRNPSDNLIAIADYVSEIKKIKHPFDKGISAREGIEF